MTHSMLGVSTSTLCIITGFVAWKLLLWLVKIYIRQSAMPPGPRGLPIVGNSFQIMSENPWLLLTEWTKQYGPIYSLSSSAKRHLSLERLTCLNKGTRHSERDV
ncbi:hypothetical protein BDW22DRAFT_576285 [Trametopsis cervina]|nr:hypothetical protein BDW22DRAFT_576285 [Trametopsis cervina]